MGTYDLTLGETAPSQFDYGKTIVLKRTMNAAALIAADTTLTANAKITAADVLQAINVPAGFVATGAAVKVTEAGTAGNTIDVGVSAAYTGSDTDGFINGGDIVTLTSDSTSALLTAVGDGYGPDNMTGFYFGEDATIDVIYVADEVIGEFTLYITGYMLD